ncbi:hypothetical protein CRG98_037194 [Punica granatum]|uniref:Uncharacterized protein n=1 Tax=Punica granatum TaxID=22663 RepID=A0A2I0IF47_PUNGR|nr:hypothetical protein CRG98_037194 [Punica granatum]
MPPINTTFLEPGTPTHADQFASPTQFFIEADTEQERRLKRMEETIRALQAMTTSSSGRRGKEVAINAVNPAHPAPQQYSMNFMSASPWSPPMLRMRLNIGLNPLPNRSTTLHCRLHPHLRYHRPLSTTTYLLHYKPLNTNPRL